MEMGKCFSWVYAVQYYIWWQEMTALEQVTLKMTSTQTIFSRTIYTGALLVARTELFFFLVILMNPCFGFMMKTALIQAALSAIVKQCLHKWGLLCFSQPTSEEAGGAQPGQLTPHCMTSCSARKIGGKAGGYHCSGTVKALVNWWQGISFGLLWDF